MVDTDLKMNKAFRLRSHRSSLLRCLTLGLGMMPFFAVGTAAFANRPMRSPRATHTSVWQPSHAILSPPLFERRERNLQGDGIIRVPVPNKKKAVKIPLVSTFRKLVAVGPAALIGLIMFGFSSAAKASSIGAGALTMPSATGLALPSSWQLMVAAALLVPTVGGSALSVLTSSMQSFIVYYMMMLQRCPIVTKSVTAGIIGVMGDYMAQGLERALANRKKSKHAVAPRQYDSRRGLSILLDGLLISGPVMHLAYEWFERLVPVHTSAGASAMAAMTHVVADSILLDSIFVATTFIVTGLMEGYTNRQLVSQLKTDYMSTIMASWVTSIGLLPIEFVCFRFLPVPLRVLAVNFIDVIWDTVISFMAHRSRKHNAAPTGYHHPVATPIEHTQAFPEPAGMQFA